MSLGVLAALATTWVGGWTMVKLRQRNARVGGERRERARGRRARRRDLAAARWA